MATRSLPLRLDRLTTIGEWLAHPVGHAYLQPVVNAMRLRLFGAHTEDGAGGGDMARAFLYEMPVGKLPVFGALAEDDLARMIEEATAGDAAADRSSPGAGGDTQSPAPAE